MKTYGRAIRRLAIANVRTHALTKKATLQAQREVKSSVKVKMRNLMTSVSRPINENNISIKTRNEKTNTNILKIIPKAGVGHA